MESQGQAGATRAEVGGRIMSEKQALPTQMSVGCETTRQCF